MADYRRDNRGGDRNRGKKDQGDGKTRAEHGVNCVQHMVNLLKKNGPTWLYTTNPGRMSFVSFREQPIYTLTVALAFSAVDGAQEAMHVLSCYSEGEESLAYAVYSTAKKLGYVAPEKPSDLHSTIRTFLVGNVSAKEYASLKAIADKTHRPATTIAELAARRSQMQELVAACKPVVKKTGSGGTSTTRPVQTTTVQSKPKPVDEAVDFGSLGNGNASTTRPAQSSVVRLQLKPISEAIDFAGVSNRSGHQVDQISDEEALRELEVGGNDEGGGENFENPFWQEDALVVRLRGVTTDNGYVTADVQKAARFIVHLEGRRMPYDQAVRLMDGIKLVLHAEEGEGQYTNPADADPGEEAEESTASDSGGTVEEIGF